MRYFYAALFSFAFLFTPSLYAVERSDVEPIQGSAEHMVLQGMQFLSERLLQNGLIDPSFVVPDTFAQATEMIANVIQQKQPSFILRQLRLYDHPAIAVLRNPNATADEYLSVFNEVSHLMTSALLTKVHQAIERFQSEQREQKARALLMRGLQSLSLPNYTRPLQEQIAVAPTIADAQKLFHKAMAQAAGHAPFESCYDKAAINAQVARVQGDPDVRFNDAEAVVADVLAPLRKSFRLWAQAKSLADSFKKEPQQVFADLQTMTRSALLTQASFASGRRAAHIKRTAQPQHDSPAQKKEKAFARARNPKRVFTLPTSVPVAPDRYAYIPRDWVRRVDNIFTSAAEDSPVFILLTDEQYNGQPLEKHVPCSFDPLELDQNKRVYPFEQLSAKQKNEWRTWRDRLNKGEIFGDSSGTKALTPENIASFDNKDLYWRQERAGIGSWYEPLQPAEQRLLTAIGYKGQPAFGGHNGSIRLQQHDPAAGNAPDYLPNNDVIDRYRSSIRYKQQTGNQYLVKEQNGRIRSADKIPLVSFGQYPHFFRKLAFLGGEMGVYALLHAKLREARNEHALKVLKAHAPQVLDALKNNDYKTLTKLLRFVPFNPFHSRSLMHMLAYVAAVELFYWGKHKLVDPGFAAAIKDNMEKVIGMGFKRVEATGHSNNVDDIGTRYIKQNPAGVIHGAPLPLYPLVEQLVSGRVTLLSPINQIFSFFVNDTIDTKTVGALRGIAQASVAGMTGADHNEAEAAYLHGGSPVRPGFYSSQWFQFARRLLISFFTLRSLDSNYAATLAKELVKHKKVVQKRLRRYTKNAYDLPKTDAFMKNFIAEKSQLSGGSVMSFLCRMMKFKGGHRALKNAQVVFAHRVKASLMVNMLLALPVIARTLYRPLKQIGTALLEQRRGG